MPGVTPGECCAVLLELGVTVFFANDGSEGHGLGPGQGR